MDKLDILEAKIEQITDQARTLGLDFFPVRFELCPADLVYTFAAYGLPTRFRHWSFGKAYYLMKTQYEFNLNRLYELVINSEPCYAFLLQGNSMVQQQLVAAHVLAHSDFFKNNYYFKKSSRRMLETMSLHAKQIKDYQAKYGFKTVEIFLDAVLAVQEHFNPYDQFYPEKDLLLVLAERNLNLEDWQRNLIYSIRKEIGYFWPQMQTKFLNEGWATFWHTAILRNLPLTEDEVIEAAKMNAGLLVPSRTVLNPYLTGYKIFEHIINTDPLGLEKIFEVRAAENDISFFRNYLTDDLIEECDLYLYQRSGSEWLVVETEPAKVRQGLLKRFVNCGFPTILVEDTNYHNQGYLYLKHVYEEMELDVPYLEKTLQHVHLIWGKPVFLETVVDNKTHLFSYDGMKNSRKVLP